MSKSAVADGIREARFPVLPRDEVTSCSITAMTGMSVMPRRASCFNRDPRRQGMVIPKVAQVLVTAGWIGQLRGMNGGCFGGDRGIGMR